MERMKELYQKQATTELMNNYHYKNMNQLPKITKVVINAGVGRAIANSKFMEEAIDAVKKITGQAPVITKAKKSIAGFKVREGMNVGVSVTLRGEKMYEFLDRLVNIALPRVRDFRGIKSNAFDGHGNYSLGMKEHGFFPEISFEEAGTPISLQINVATTAKTDDEAKTLLTSLGFPFRS
ncbi:MAG: 50S ribosomal protein L5 [Patescibacteria group bacterium]|nr:50S ribosomal protein L5 [Patescibacteria group bacterium]